jgi:hypothetical protein
LTLPGWQWQQQPATLPKAVKLQLGSFQQPKNLNSLLLSQECLKGHLDANASHVYSISLLANLGLDFDSYSSIHSMPS